RAAEDLRRLVAEKLAAAQLAHGKAASYVTARRLTLVVEDLPAAQPDVSEERRGPRVGAPEQAVQGFLKAAGIASLAECEERDTGKGVFYFAMIRRAGRPTVELLPELLRAAILELPWPKSMRFPAAPFRWVRPLSSVICLLDGRVLPLDLGSVPVGNVTRGHRFLSQGTLTVANFADYAEKLRAAYVVLDPAARRRKIADDLALTAQGLQLALKDDPGLLDEVTGLVEFPVVLAGTIDHAFMSLPAEVLTTSMRSHQKYFACLDGTGALAPKFLVVANNLTADGGATIVAGNEKVLRARLSDAQFFWDQDRKARLESRVEKLGERIFHAKLGSVLDKVKRIEALTREIAPLVPDADAKLAERAAHLAKADLSTGMVGEFPELQGIVGRYYAAHDGEKAEIADAIAEHYSPLGPNDRCPTAPNSVVVALADKIDTLVGFFSIDEKPTGSKDPYALRRAALGVIRLILENNLRLPLAKVFRQAFIIGGEKSSGALGREPTVDLLDFFADRLKVYLREQGVRHDLIAAVFAPRPGLAAQNPLPPAEEGRVRVPDEPAVSPLTSKGAGPHPNPLPRAGEGIVAASDQAEVEDDLVRLLARVAALDAFLKSEDGANLLVAYRRASNIVRIEEKKDGRSYDALPEADALQMPQELALAERLAKVGHLSDAALKQEEFGVAMQALAQLRRPVDEFFSAVTVNCEDAKLRLNRLRLLSQIRATLNRVADFSQIEG
ncbi:MAG: glycine--tRNA ligase subunit beta, partial [Alphaproteobacteria bacterium]|nr:glycine--tRNA ligase subunit beta [Alphaproteobacteria bacterium]